MKISRAAAFVGATAMAVSTLPASAAETKAGSVYLQCDGRPNNVTAGETAARLIALTLVVGLLAPQNETADASKRLKGEAGARACTTALEGGDKGGKGEGNPIRRAELALARAIHRIEAGQYDAAIAEARGLASVSPAAGEPGFARSLGLSAMEVEATALAHQGKLAEAEAVALRMAAASPLDLVNVLRAETYLKLTPAYGEDKQRYFANAVRLQPLMLVDRALARGWSGDFRGMAADYGMVTELLDLKDPSAPLAATQAAALILAGDVAKSDELAGVARARVAALEVGAEADASRNAIRDTREALDFVDIAKLAATGKMDEARLKFSSRSSWSIPSPPMVAALTERLRAGASPAQLTGALALSPGEMRSKELAARLAAVTDEKKQAARLYALRTYRKPGATASYARKVWKTDKSKYLVTLKPKEGDRPTRFEILTMTDVFGDPAGEAILLHAALLAQKRGKTGFALHPLRTRLNGVLLVFGDKGDPGIPADVHLDAAQLIAALAPQIPKPEPS